MIRWRDQLVSIINVRVLLNFQIFISYRVRIMSNNMKFHITEKYDNDVITQQEVGILVWKPKSLKSAKSHPYIPKISIGYRPVSSINS